MTKKYQKFQDYLVEKLRQPEEAENFINAAIAEYETDGDTKSLMLAIRYLAEAKGGLAKLSTKTHLNRQNLYKILTGKTTPNLSTTFTILNGLGYNLQVVTRGS